MSKYALPNPYLRARVSKPHLFEDVLEGKGTDYGNITIQPKPDGMDCLFGLPFSFNLCFFDAEPFVQKGVSVFQISIQILNIFGILM